MRERVAALLVACLGCGSSAGGKGQPDASSPDASSEVRKVDTSVYLTIRSLNVASHEGIVLNGLKLGPLHADSLSELDLAALSSETLTDSGKTLGQADREVLAYAFSCAFDQNERMELQIGGETWEFEGQLGLAPQWKTGPCDSDCQQWVSACVLARTNQFDIPVQLSLRGDHPALAVPAQVANEFTLREGSFYGNLFNGQVDGNAFACAGGRGGAIWELTHRFCSVIGDDCPVETIADCNVNEFACDLDYQACSSRTACSSWNEAGLPTTCHDQAHVCGTAPTGNAYNKIITAYIRPPQPNCGNAICEQGEAETCASDCDGQWAVQFGSGCHEDSAGLAVTGSGEVAIAGRFIGDIDFGGLVHSTSSDTDTDLFVAKLDANGQRIWSRSLDATGEQTMVRSVATDSAGNVLIAGHFATTADFGTGSVTPNGFSYFVARYSAADGQVDWVTTLEGNQSIFGSQLSSLPNPQIAIDSQQGVLLATDFVGTVDLGLGAGNPSASHRRDILVVRLDNGGNLDWHRTITGDSDELVGALDVDGDDNLLLAGSFSDQAVFGPSTLTSTGSSDRDGFVARLAASDGATLWAKRIGGAAGTDRVQAITVGPSGDVAIAGDFTGRASVAGEAEIASVDNQATGLPSVDAFVAVFDSAGGLSWVKHHGSSRTDLGRAIDWNGTDSYVVATTISTEIDETLVIEGTRVSTGESGDIVLIRYGSDGTALSVSPHGSPVSEVPTSLVASGDVVTVSGIFMGTLRFGGTYLTNAGGSWSDQRPANVFVSRVESLR